MKTKFTKNKTTESRKVEKIKEAQEVREVVAPEINKVSGNIKHNWKTSLIFLLLAISLYFYFSYGLNHLAQFETADEYRWIYSSESRIPQYWTAMLAKDWKHTMINDKPGISTAVVSGLGLWYIGEDTLEKRIVLQNKYSAIFNPEASQNINFAFRLPLLVFNGLLAVLWYFLLRRLANDNWLALLACSFILLSPILIGISQIVNPDTLLWSTAFTAILSFLLFLKYQKWYDGLLFGIFLGLALLSKYTAVVIIPYAFFLIGAYLAYKSDEFVQKMSLRKRVLQFFLSFPFIAGLGVLVYALLLPAVFLDPDLLLKGNEAFKGMKDYVILMGQISGAILLDAIIFKSWILKKILFALKYLWSAVSRIVFGGLFFIFFLEIWNWTHDNFLGIPEIPYDTGMGKAFKVLPLIHKIFLEIHPLVFSITPIILFLMLATWLIYTFKKERRFVFPVFAASIFLPIFYAAVIQEKLLVHIRYSVMLYPLVSLIAAAGLAEIFDWLKFRYNFVLKITIFLLIIWTGVSSLNYIRPFYFNYTSDLLPKSRTITGAWGYGGYEAAQYINSQSKHPENLIVWTDYDGFCPFFSGTCIKDSEIKWVGINTTNKISYYVVTTRGSGQLSSTWAKLRPNVGKKPDWRINIGGRPGNFIKVFKVIKSDFKNDDWWRNK